MYIYYNRSYVNNAKKGGWQEIHQTINCHFLQMIILGVIFSLLFNLQKFLKLQYINFIIENDTIDSEVNGNQDDNIGGS